MDTHSDTDSESTTVTVRVLKAVTEQANRVSSLVEMTLDVFDRLQNDLRQFAKNATGETSHTLAKMKEFDTIRLRELVGNYSCHTRILRKVLRLERLELLSEPLLSKCTMAFDASDEVLKTLVERIRAANRRLEPTEAADRGSLGFRRMMAETTESPSELDVQASLKACATAAEVAEEFIGDFRNQLHLDYQSGVEISNSSKRVLFASSGDTL